MIRCDNCGKVSAERFCSKKCEEEYLRKQKMVAALAVG
ncbi:MAG: DUF2116 family Zn-ribbon domain-containing protein [Thaumarchaeota archaeon]|nr:DUF2116 family Zn-ribbon domain-containing protein [Nitrososphaerota archaeon]